VSLSLPKLPKLRVPKKGRGRIPDELSDYVTFMTMSSPDRRGLCGRDVKMRTDSLKGQTEDGFSFARDDRSSKSNQIRETFIITGNID